MTKRDRGDSKEKEAVEWPGEDQTLGLQDEDDDEQAVNSRAYRQCQSRIVSKRRRPQQPSSLLPLLYLHTVSTRQKSSSSAGRQE